MEHPLVKLAELIDWHEFEHSWSGLFPSKRGRPATSTRLIAGLLYLQHAQGCSDEELLWTWVENPYMQYLWHDGLPAPVANRSIIDDSLA